MVKNLLAGGQNYSLAKISEGSVFIVLRTCQTMITAMEPDTTNTLMRMGTTGLISTISNT